MKGHPFYLTFTSLIASRHPGHFMALIFFSPFLPVHLYSFYSVGSAFIMPPKSVFELVKSHIQLPVNRDYAALKRVLREWHQYSTQVPLQEKPTFPAELLITITRAPPSVRSHDIITNSSSSKWTSKLLNQNRKPSTSSSHAHSRRWSLWKSRAAALTAANASPKGDGAAAAGDRRDEKPFVYQKVVPLHVWTSVLPWEMQRGLSFSDLVLPPSLTDSGDDGASTADHEHHDQGQEGKHHPGKAAPAGEEEEEDPYGIVTPAATSTPPASTPVSAHPLAATNRPVTTVAASAPAMLFLSDMPSARAYGTGFWSGAIRQPIDVIFVAPTLPTSVGPSSASFQRLRAQDGLAAVEDNHVSQQVLTRYFPLQEIQPTSSSASSSSVVFRVHSFSHLDPLPPTIHPSRLDTEARGCAAAAALSFTATPDGPYESAHEAPRYVFETPRHTLQPAVAAALQESRSILRAQTGGGTMVSDNDGDVSIDLVVNFSDALRDDIFAKAQLCVEYVSLLEEAIAHYAQELSTDRAAATVAAKPLDAAGRHSDTDPAGDANAAGNERPIKVWLSEHESRWMTPSELRKAAQSSTNSVNEQREEQEEEGGQAEDEAAAYSMTARAAGAAPTPADADAVTSAGAASVLPASPSASDAAALAAEAVGATPAQPGAVSAARSISLQSPILRDESEGRPSYLAPSFVGRHESSLLQRSAVVLSADKLARYPETHSNMPQLPPIDYELYDLCMRLGVGQHAILYYYHERILKEWRAELQRRRSRARSRGHGGSSGDGTQQGKASASLIHPADVERMVALVRDRSLQLSPELVAVVEAVAAA